MDNMKLYAKMFAIMNESEAIEKNMTVGKGQNAYKAVSEAAMLNLVKPLFKKYKLIVFPVEGNIQDNVMVWEKTGYEGKVENNLRAITELKAFYKIVDTESGEFEILVGFGNGADPQDKGAGKASTYSFKNMLSKTFMLFSGEDTDNIHSDDINKEYKPKVEKIDPEMLISEAQQRYICEIGAIDIVKKALLAKGYTKSGAIKQKDYESMCAEVRKAVSKEVKM